MFMGAYKFDGNPDTLVEAYRRLLDTFPLDSIDLQVCVRRDAGVIVYDACPTAEIFGEFSQSEGFLGAVAAAGLPVPRVEPIGEVQSARLRESIGP